MNCPLCQEPLTVTANEYYPAYPNYSCSVDGEHYLKYFSNDWSYSRYVERARHEDYSITNYYNYRDGQPDLVVITKRYIMTEPVNDVQYSWRRVFRLFGQTIKIPPQDQFTNKIKTLLLFS